MPRCPRRRTPCRAPRAGARPPPRARDTRAPSSMASLSSSRSNGLVRYSLAPAFIASTACSTLPWAVSMMIGNGCSLPRKRRRTSMPSGAGIRWSSTMMSGSCSATAASASLPSAASTTSKPSVVERLPEHPAHVLLVVDDEDALAHDTVLPNARSCGRKRHGERRPSGALSTSICPSCSSMMRCTIVRPSPVPSVALREERVEHLGQVLGGIPGPCLGPSTMT